LGFSFENLQEYFKKMQYKEAIRFMFLDGFFYLLIFHTNCHTLALANLPLLRDTSDIYLLYN